MSFGSTPVQGLPYPHIDEPLSNSNHWVKGLATAVEGQLVMRFATTAARDAAITAPVAGMMTWLSDSGTLVLYDGTGWKQVYPYAPATYSGTTTPPSSLGNPGDFYIQHA